MNCKPGDLAIIVASKAPANIGLIVKVIEPALGPGDYWVVTTTGPAISLTDAIVAPGERARCGDWCLRPIRGQGDRLQVTTDRTTDEGVTA